ncbi:glycoside hydrolase family 2 TIM barrel-domain containing protein [Winogradskyella forsetii]|uniref:glycoside hydrolase family 2 TIM barrel-domain containing protein n=1 Tax=Winogradskyella forsetii TaxID=2686077 RepID=UPI0015BB77C8|nr:glycoside hydrolase family 2 TIM barrel-domain containing protein [Winogradskyella forsetii]
MPHTIHKILSLCLLMGVALSFHSYSQSKVINSGWQFSEDQSNWQTVNIPHTWNKTDAFDDLRGYRRGLGYYQKQVFIPLEESDKIHYLKFNAVNQEATILVNGIKVGSHKGGYTAFNFNITEFVKYNAYNLIQVTVDNSHNVDIPPLDADFTFYGGIYRDVELITLSKQHFSLDDFASEGFYINYPYVSKGAGKIEVTGIINNSDVSDAKLKLIISLIDHEDYLLIDRTEKFEIKSKSSESIVSSTLKIVHPKLWSPESPYLYKLKLVLQDNEGNILDSKTSNVGFRWASVDPEKGFFLNGKPIKLIGVNRHQDYKGFGNAVPMALQKEDIHLIKDMGANVVRFAHYPHSRALYDLCDELGILVWTEIPVINLVTDSKAYFDVSLAMQKEHIKQYYNHPSVVMFGYMNEIFIRLAFNNKLTAADKENLKVESVKLATQLENLTRRLAPNHITVMACHLNDVYNETGIADLPMLLGWNLYFGWYDRQIEDLGPFLDEQHRRFPNRVLFLSEYGPGADVRIFTDNPKKFDFSTDYQAKLHQSYYKQIADRPFMAGMTAWNFADFGSEFRGDAIPHVNQKGLVQYDRTPKDVYYWYKSVLDDTEPFVYIATAYLNGLTLFKNETYPIQIYSNQKEASVVLNGKTLKTVQFENGVATIEVPFEHGKNKINVVSGDIDIQNEIDINRIQSLDFNDFERFGINIGAHFFFYDEERNITFVPDQPYKLNWFGHFNGEAFGMTKDKNQGIPHNIKNSTSEPLFQTMLEGCSTYKVDIPNGRYKVDLFFVEPQIKPTENIYNLSEATNDSEKKQRIFDISINNIVVEKRFNMVKAYPEKYGITLSTTITILNNKGLTIDLKPIEGQPVISGILIEKMN